jgi:hypothetical protein
MKEAKFFNTCITHRNSVTFPETSGSDEGISTENLYLIQRTIGNTS